MKPRLGLSAAIKTHGRNLSLGNSLGVGRAPAACRVARFLLAQYTKTGENIPYCH
jgi:hypothetical protein